MSYNINTTDRSTYNSIGSYVFGYMAITSITQGSTYAGSSIFPAGQTGVTDRGANTWAPPSAIVRGSAALTGTWRATGRGTYASGSNRTRNTIFVRIS